MHAVIINVTIKDRSAAEAELQELVPRLAGAPGFVAGYWVALSENKGTSIAVFDSEAAAQAMLPQVADTGAVTMESVEVGEVVGHA